MTRQLVWTLIVLAGVGVTRAEAQETGQGTSLCRQADAWTTAVLQWLDSLGTSADTFSVRGRAAFEVPRTSSDSVRLVSEPELCIRAARTLAQLRQLPDSVRPVYVFRVGSAYAVSDPLWQLGNGQRVVSFFTAEWRATKGAAFELTARPNQRMQLTGRWKAQVPVYVSFRCGRCGGVDL